MARSSDTYVCQSCGAVYAKWAGRCDACGEWNSIELETQSAPPGAVAVKDGKGNAIRLDSLEGDIQSERRLPSGNAEFDRAVGGGLVPGGALLVGGDPGVGKSTLLLQIAAGLAQEKSKVAYISGEEAIAQIRMRAKRLGLSKAPVGLASGTNLRDILATLRTEKPDVVIIDSIQTLWTDTLPAAPGTVTQVRACAQELVRFAKQNTCAIILVGHVTKDGQLAGPRVVEHLVDAVLYFESESGRSFRILRAVKNRFGAAHEIGVFEMTGGGLREVSNPSALFLSEGDGVVSGSVVFAGIEGTRPLLCEIQALVSQSSLGAPRRAVVGWDSARLSMLLAVLDTRCGLDFGRHDVFLNVAGGLKISEPAADMAAAAALLSARLDTPVPPKMVVFGEIGLSGAVRPVPQMPARMGEAEKLGFEQVLCPALGEDKPKGLRSSLIGEVADLVNYIKGL
ncbi:DNA repair protein RadA [Parvularcula sp. LCG005]|uniref:DNA repair protein RadA n=1 Tax=Parvularcula sp. LCG005 TaxID=3078805 RepID=UPI00294385ED|nr:DNA repair protein RadA [Parvularcula sp. LCG005]WOI52859.1 DNA repair protein RadA [Parvularcula sp. LCG005]